MENVETSYRGIRTIHLIDSGVKLYRRFSRVRPWRNCLDEVYLDGTYEDEGGASQQAETLTLNRFNGKVTLPSSRKTSLIAQNSAVSGDHPLGAIQSVGSAALDIKAPDHFGDSEQPNYVVEIAKNLGVIGGVVITAQLISSMFGESGWNPDISLLIGAGANIGIMGGNIRTLTLSSLIGAGIIFGPEVLGRDTLGSEDLLKMVEFAASGLGGKIIRRVYDSSRA